MAADGRSLIKQAESRLSSFIRTTIGFLKSIAASTLKFMPLSDEAKSLPSVFGETRKLNLVAPVNVLKAATEKFLTMTVEFKS